MISYSPSKNSGNFNIVSCVAESAPCDTESFLLEASAPSKNSGNFKIVS
jgi:hypothetical protein